MILLFIFYFARRITYRSKLLRFPLKGGGSFHRVLIFSSWNFFDFFQFLSRFLCATKNPYIKGFFFILRGNPGIKCKSFAFYIYFMRVFFHLIYCRGYIFNIIKLRNNARSLTVRTPRSPMCAQRIKGIGNKNEIWKFITVKRVAEQVSLLDWVFIIPIPITESNLLSIRKTRFDQLTIKKNFKTKITT